MNESCRSLRKYRENISRQAKTIESGRPSPAP